MERRDFCKVMGAAMGLAGASSLSGAAFAAKAQPTDVDTHSSGGFTLEPAKEYLFTDVRHIDSGELVWNTLGGEYLPLSDPPEPAVPAIADKHMVPHGIRFEAQPARVEELGEAPPSNQLYDGGIYRDWRLQTASGQNGVKSLSVQYRESTDGYHYTPKGEPNEIGVSGLTEVDGASFFMDPNGAPDERYKGVFSAHVLGPTSRLDAMWARFQRTHPYFRDDRLRRDYLYGIFGLVSPDGINWKMLAEPLLVNKGDTLNTACYDAFLGKYVIYTRLYQLRRRGVGRAVSDDFRNWGALQPVLAAGLESPIVYDVYTNCRSVYPGLPSHHLMFPMFYNRYDERSEIHLFSSIDGIYWNHVPGSPVLTPTSQPGKWHGEFLYVTGGLVPLGGDRIALGYSESNRPHKYPRWNGVTEYRSGYAWWPKGRLCALVADEAGKFYTFSMPLTGRALRLNARVFGAGAIRVGVYGPDCPKDPKSPWINWGRWTQDCDPILGDSFEHVVTWKGSPDIPLATGSTVGLHFQLRSAQLFGFEWV